MTKYKLTENGVQNTETGGFVPNSPGNRHWQEYQQWLSQGNEPDPEYTEEELKQQKIVEIKQKAYEDILNIAPEWKQRNMLAVMLELQEKRLDGLVLTDEEKGILQQSKQTWTDIKNIRYASNKEEEKL